MTKEQLIELGLNEEQIKEVFRLNGIAVTNVREEVSDLESEIATLEKTNETLGKQIETANNQIEKFKEVDVDELESEITKYKDLYEESQIDFESELNNIKLEQEIKLKVIETEPYNVDDVISRLNKDNIKNTENGILGINEELERIKEEYPHYYPKQREESGFRGQDPHDPVKKPEGSKSYDDFLSELTK